MPALIIHGHFYQPPRENPWTGVVEVEPSAAPFHDWNERIHSECYQPNGCTRITDPATGRERVVNNYTNISFNFGPTLLSWLKSNHPLTYAGIIDADQPARANAPGMATRSRKLTVMRFCRCVMNATGRRRFAGACDFRDRFGASRKRSGCLRPLAMTT